MANQSSVNTTTIVLLIASIVISAGGGYYLSSNSLQSKLMVYSMQVEELESEVNALLLATTSLENENSNYYNQITEYNSEINNLETQMASQESHIEILTNENTEYQHQIYELSNDLEFLNQSYIGLQHTLNFHSLGNNSRELIFTLNTSTSGYDENIITFDVGYGILMDVFVSLSSSMDESEIDIELSWRRGDRSGFLVGLGNAHAEGYEVVTVRAYCEIYDEESNLLWIKVGAQIIELPWMEKSRITTFSIP